MGICEAYNKGAPFLSKYDYLLFVHEDVLFHTVRLQTNLDILQ